MAKWKSLAKFFGGIALVVACIAMVIWGKSRGWQRGRDVDRDKFLATARESDARVARVYQLFPNAEARFNDGNRAGRRGAFAAIAETFTLTAKLRDGYQLKLYRGIAPRVAAPDGVTVVEGAYGLQSPNGRLADLTPDEFDALLEAKGDVGVMKEEIWTRMPLPSKHLGWEKTPWD